MFSKAAPPLSSNNVELGWKGENRGGCEVTLQKVCGNGPALPHWKWEVLMQTFYGHSWTRFKGKKKFCRYCRTSTLLVFYWFEQSSLHSLKRETLQCFKAFLLLYHLYYHFKANFFDMSSADTLELVSTNSPFSSNHTWSRLPIAGRISAMPQRQTVLCSFAPGNSLVPKNQTPPWIHVQSTNKGNLTSFVPPLVFWRYSSPLPITAFCNKNPDFLSWAYITVFMVFFFQTRSVLKILVHRCKFLYSYVGSDVSAQKLRGLGPSLSYYMDEKEEKKGDRGFIKPHDLLL